MLSLGSESVDKKKHRGRKKGKGKENTSNDAPASSNGSECKAESQPEPPKAVAATPTTTCSGSQPAAASQKPVWGKATPAPLVVAPTPNSQSVRPSAVRSAATARSNYTEYLFYILVFQDNFDRNRKQVNLITNMYNLNGKSVLAVANKVFRYEMDIADGAERCMSLLPIVNYLTFNTYVKDSARAKDTC